MTTREAKAMMEQATMMYVEGGRLDEVSKVNPGMTIRDAMIIVSGSVAANPDDHVLSDLFEKRVYQVCRNQRRPRYK